MWGVPKPDYIPVSHAAVTGDDIAWVAIGYWDFGDRKEWCVEYWDEYGEAGEDKCFDSHSDATVFAAAEFGLSESDWIPGPQPFGPKRT
jgi:hypothetical protein